MNPHSDHTYGALAPNPLDAPLEDAIAHGLAPVYCRACKQGLLQAVNLRRGVVIAECPSCRTPEGAPLRWSWLLGKQAYDTCSGDSCEKCDGKVCHNCGGSPHAPHAAQLRPGVIGGL